jgi:hypothetical protein
MLHDYLRDTRESRYNECKSCRNRTQFTCIRCGFCYSCHWKKEELEKQIHFKSLIANSTLFKKYPQSIPAAIVPIKQQVQQSEQQLKVIDVYGQEIEPICNYHTCHHKFSLHSHSTRVCKCNHPQNYAMGI